MADDWITTSEAVEVTGYNAEYIRRLIRSGKVKGRKFGIVWQVQRASLHAYLQGARGAEDRRRGPRP